MKAHVSVILLLTLVFPVSLLADSDTIEGTVRSVDADMLRVVVMTASDEIVAAFGTGETPVRFEGSTYRIENLEVGDVIRMTLKGEGDDRRVEAIDVLESVSPSERPRTRPASEPATSAMLIAPSDSLTLTSVTGKVDQTREDRNLIRIIAEGGLEWVRIDASTANTPDGDPFRVADLEFGETIQAIGTIGDNGELVATIIRRESEIGEYQGSAVPARVEEPEQREPEPAPVPAYAPADVGWLDIVEFEGEVVTPLDGTQKLTIRNNVNGANETVWCDSSLVALVDGDDPIEASDLEEGMYVEIRALRVSEGLVAQSINVDD